MSEGSAWTFVCFVFCSCFMGSCYGMDYLNSTGHKIEWIKSKTKFCLQDTAQVVNEKHTIKKCWMPKEVIE